MDHLDLTPQPIDKKVVTPAQTYEFQILELSGLKASQDFHVENVPIEFYGPNYIHTVQFGDKNSLDLVMIHGYLLSGVIFYRMVKELAKTFRVYIIDLLGMGQSSRPKFTLDDTTQIIEFFIDSIEKWRVAKGLKKFQIMGFSLGGYVACHYALKYSENIHKVSLISPAGITKHPEEMDMSEFTKTFSFTRRMMLKFLLSVWGRKTTPQRAFKSLGFIGRSLVSRYINNRFQRPTEESELLYNYVSNVMQMPESSDKAFYYLFKPPKTQAVLPLEEYMLDMDMPVDFYYGDKDWMDSAGAKRVCENASGRCNLYWIKNSGHHVSMDNPDMLSKLLTNNSASLITRAEDKTAEIQQHIWKNGTGVIGKGLGESLKIQDNKKDKEKISVKSTENEKGGGKEEFSKEEVLLMEGWEEIPPEVGSQTVGVGTVKYY